ncbi:hypothetical protein ACIGW1_18475 [Streptomyces sp. NPDC053780]|uniref:hypothetical protein n=1 Tax=unclassified Streptomyces TaxID=2593676 RepID=UPI00344877DC
MPKNKVRRTFIDHSACEHENTQSGRRLCRLDHLHDECEHEQTQHARAWCTRRKDEAKEAAK